MTHSGQALWEKAKQVIPGGCQLLSKRPERFLPGQWPAYYKKAKGCEVWDLDGRKYRDFAQMGVGSCVLGYSDDDVNRAVIEAVQNGSMSSLNCYEEVELAERLISLHPWSDMVRFARSGGEACAIAIRIARAATGKDRVVLCGYHGWHDWYLSANLESDSRLDGQLLPGLKPKGVPRNLRGTTLVFNYNKLNELEALVDEFGPEIGVICMEPVRGTPPDERFLKGVRDIATKIGAVLIFDEVTSGFRMNLGGVHRTLGVDPDIAVFGKALGNGHPISAVLGRRNVMEAAQESFVSSTFWTERVGFVAALATLQKTEKNGVPAHLISAGHQINAAWQAAATKHDLPISISGIPPLTTLSFKCSTPLEFQTLYAQEMLERGYLVGSAIYATYAYTKEILDQFAADTEWAFGRIAEASRSGNLLSFLKGPVMQPGFKRLT